MTKSIMTGAAQTFGQGIFDQSSTQEADLGAKVTSPDGSCYRYAKMGATVGVAGKLYDGPAGVANHTGLVAIAGAIGGTTITATLGGTAATLNQYAGGYAVINAGTGQGYTYIIESHPAQTSTSGTITLTLDPETPVQEALDTTARVSLVANQYNGLVIHPVTEIGMPVGVTVLDMTIGYYGWIKTRGPVSCLVDATGVGIGLSSAASTTTAGNVTVGTGPLSAVGYQLATGVSSEYNPVFLTIDKK